ncbi:GNAT family N-acetyltransferase [soil metagenome]
MRIQEVQNSEDIQEFLMLPVRLYKSIPQWIRPLDKDVDSVFDKEKNKAFRHGECTRWLLKNDSGETIGRVAAFVVEKNVHKGNDQPTGGMGFFECINDKAAAYLLFDQCKSWLVERKMEAMDGPINFGSRDRWWGLLVEGFENEPNYQCNYNFPFYQEFFESYGFQLYFNQLTFARKVMEPLSEKLDKKAKLVAADLNYSFRFIPKNEINKLPEYLRIVYNKAWANRAENPELTQAQAVLLVKQMKPIIDERLLWFGFYKDDPVAFFVSLPEINQVFKHVNGKLNLIGKLKFLWIKMTGSNKKAFGILFGVVPEHQGVGVDGAIIMAARKLYQSNKMPYVDYEMNWIGDFNPKMIQVVEQVGGFVSKKHITYRKLFDASKPFKRHPILK